MNMEIWELILWVLMALIVIGQAHRMKIIEDKMKQIETDTKTMRQWTLFLLNRREADDKKRSESIHPSEEGR
jgi:hypothetical protein